MTKKKAFRVVLVLILMLLLSAAGVFYVFVPKRAALFPDFSPMPMDTAGDNLIGNLPENLEAGGFMAGQNGWIYFANFADGGALYMCRENGGDLTKITDFPVCNINVLGTSLVFTGFERDISGNVFDVGAFPKEAEADFDASIGGKLYAIYGMNSTSKPHFCVIGSDTAYYSPYLDRDGLYVTYSALEQSVVADKFDDTKMVFPKSSGRLEKIFSSGSMIYAEFSGWEGKGSSIVRIDAKTLMPLDCIDGESLFRFGKGFIFHAKDDYIYELTPASGEIKPISVIPVDSFVINQFGEIEADHMENGNWKSITVSKEQRYRGIAQVLMSRRESKPIVLQNGWYNYFNEYPQHDYDGKHFKANDKYYRLNYSGWSEAWLNVKLDSRPLVSLGELTVEDTFTPPWIDYSEGAEPVDFSDAGDFGSERPAPAQPDDRADAAEDVSNALDAAILLLLGDESIADKYTGESVEKLRNRYGGAFEAAVTEAAEELADTVSTRFGAKVNPEEMRDIVTIWLENASYSIGGASVASNGEDASVTLSVTNTLDLDMLYAEFQSELSAQTAGEPELSEMTANEKAAWTTDLLTQIMREPNRYHAANVRPVGSRIYMSYSGCWTADNPAALVGSLIYGK